MALFQPLLNHESVQELAKQDNLTTVPHQYVQDHREPTFVPNDPSLLPSIPIIDMNDLIMEGSNMDVQLKHLHSVCCNWGIFQLVNHGVDKSLVDQMKNEVVRFFESPIEEKLRYKLKGGEYEGYGQTILHAQGQKIDWADRFFMITNPIHRRKPNLLPDFPASLRITLEKYMGEVQKVGMSLLGLIGRSLDIENDEMTKIFEDGMQSVRMTYYPPCPQPDLVVGLTPHSDAAGITILLQLNNVQGLQVNKDAHWIPVSFLPHAFVVNVGDILQIMSNGVCNSIEHRAVVNASKERLSLAMFFNPKLEADVGPSKSLLTKTGKLPLYKTLVMEQYLKQFFSRKLNGKTFLEKMKINNQDHVHETN